MQFSSTQFADVDVAAPVGRIDHAAAEQLERALESLLAQSDLGKHGLILDFSGVEYISSVGLRVLMIAAKRMRAHNARIGIAMLQPIVAEIFAISRFDSIFDVSPTVRVAIEKLSAPALVAFDAARKTPAA